jgi:mono/diheme cytochrome c family protein
MRVGVVSLAFAFAVSACLSSSTIETAPGRAVDHGRALFEDPKASPSASNTFTCATCHRGEQATTTIEPGAPLGGVTARRSFWGGQRLDLLESVNDCRAFFMDARAPWTADDEDARAMYAFLSQLPPTTAEPVPFTVVQPSDLPAGDAKRGAIAYDLACKTCHGSAHDGAGRLATFIPILPDEVVRGHASLAPPDLRLVFIGKARMGAFRGGGSMPPFSREVLADEDLAGILAFFGLY